MTSLICFEQHSPGTCYPAQVVIWLAETGRAGLFCHLVENHAAQWPIACALEEALIDARVNKDWTLVVGRIEGDAETYQGWFESDDWVVLPYSPTRAAFGSDIGVWSADDFYDGEHRPEVWAKTPAADESGIILNRELKLNFFIDRSLGA